MELLKRLLFAIGFSTLVLLIPVGFKQVTCGFKLSKMKLQIPNRPEWDIVTDLSSEQLQSILSQPYVYLNRGAQCYVFESLDHKYVIKFFRYDRAKNKSFQEKLERLFSACLLGFSLAKEETGVLFLHLNQTKDLYPVLHAKGPIGQTLQIPLDRYRFALQKKVEPFEQALLNAYKSHDPDEMKRKIDSLLSLLESRISKGIYNSDPSLFRNFGFLGDQAIEIDFGNYSQTKISKEKEIARYTNRLKGWLVKNAPEFVSYLDNRIAHER
jgi:hypothetical protein